MKAKLKTRSSSTPVTVRRISLSDNLGQLANQINTAQWDKANEIDPGSYTEQSLKAFVAFERSVFVAAFIGDNLAGIASATQQSHPHNSGHWLYVDEVDTAVNFRRMGVAAEMMYYLYDLAKDFGCYELALGTELNNEPAKLLYSSLQPTYHEDVSWFGYEVK